MLEKIDNAGDGMCRKQSVWNVITSVHICLSLERSCNTKLANSKSCVLIRGC